MPLSAAAALIEGLEGAALVGLACYIGVATALGEPAAAFSAIALTLTTVAVGLGALLVCRALLRRRRWSRAPALVTQLLALPVAVSFVRSSHLEVGIPLMATAAVGIGVLLHPATTRVLSQRRKGVTPPA